MEQVVVVGAGLAGVAVSVFLANADVPVVVFDRRDGPSELPRARMVSARSMELLRELDLADRVLSAGRPGPLDFRVVDTLRDAAQSDAEPVDETVAVSPVGSALCDQDLLEKMLWERAAELGVHVEWGCRVDGIDLTGGAVGLRGPCLSLRSRYAVLAEGSGAALREKLHIGATGSYALAEVSDVLFRSAGLDELMSSRSGNAFVCREAGAVMFRRDQARWQIGRRAGSIDDVPALVAAAAGCEIDVDILSKQTWRPGAGVADRFRVGGVFLIGDVAHAMPPSLGMGGNTAIGDAHNLAWKLAFVLRGEADPALLDSFEPERRAVAQFLVAQSLAALRGAPTLDRATLHLGVGYPAGHSSALISREEQIPIEHPQTRLPRVGARMPHRWLPDGRSTLDLAGGSQFVTFGHPRSSVPGNVPFQVIDDLVPDGRVWLVRPDGYVAAHARPEDIPSAIKTILGPGS